MIKPNTLCDLTTLSFLIILLLFSFFSLSFIFHFRLKTLRSSQHLRNFNSPWLVRFLLVSFALLWSLSELLRLSIPSFFLTVHQQENLCKAYIVASQGLFQPCFFLTLLFLVSVSLNKFYQNTFVRPALVIFVGCLPVLLLQIFFLFFSARISFFRRLPDSFRRSHVVVRKHGHVDRVLCAYPLLNTVVLGSFGAAYAVCFVVLCCKAATVVINKTLNLRICGLAITVGVAVPLQALCLTVSVVRRPDDPLFEVLSLVGFLCVLTCIVVGEGILVIKPMTDALVVEGALHESSSTAKARVLC